MQRNVVGETMTELIELAALEPRDVSGVRRALSRQLAAWGCDRASDAVLVLSELVSNAVAYGGGATRIVIVLQGSTLRIEVHDGAASAPSAQSPFAPLGGHGLSIVDQLSADWGWRRTPTGKQVWATLPCSG